MMPALLEQEAGGRRNYPGALSFTYRFHFRMVSCWRVADGFKSPPLPSCRGGTELHSNLSQHRWLALVMPASGLPFSSGTEFFVICVAWQIEQDRLGMQLSFHLTFGRMPLTWRQNLASSNLGGAITSVAAMAIRPHSAPRECGRLT